jgi:dienelactone hydrolase
MAEVVVFHHALGLTDWIGDFAQVLRDEGHTVHVPDLFGGRTFATIEEGVAFAEQELDFPHGVVDRAAAAVADLPPELAYVGFSLGVLPAQSLAQTRPGAVAAALCYAAVALGEWDERWPASWSPETPLQLHIAEGDEDVPVATAIAGAVTEAELFLYPPGEHYFAEHDEQAAAQLLERVLALLS